MDTTVTSLGKYLGMLIPQSLYLEPAGGSGWVTGWTIYYWAWWISAAPIISLFLIKLAKGRTVRQFVMMNMLVPVIFIFMWFGIFGGGAINSQMGGARIWEDISEHGMAIAQFAFLKTLPLPTICIIMGFAATILSFVTLAESITYAMSDMTMKNRSGGKETSSPVWLKVFWGLAVALTGLSLSMSGGLASIQTLVIVLGAPTLLLILLIAYSCVKFFRHRDKYDLTLTGDEQDDEDRRAEELRPEPLKA